MPAKSTSFSWKKVARLIFLFLAFLLLVQGIFIVLVLSGKFGAPPDEQSLMDIQDPVASEVYT